MAPPLPGDRLEGLIDRPRSGRPRRYGHDERIKIAAKAREAVPADSPVATWTYASLAGALADDVGVSRSQLWRILAGMDLKRAFGAPQDGSWVVSGLAPNGRTGLLGGFRAARRMVEPKAPAKYPPLAPLRPKPSGSVIKT